MKTRKILNLSVGLFISLALFSTNSNAGTKKESSKQQVQKEAHTKKAKPSKKTPTPQKRALSPTDIKYAVFNYANGETYESKAADTIWPIASLTKLMTAEIFVKNHPNIDGCYASINESDRDLIKNTGTKLAFNKPYSCRNLLEVMLVASDNYAASALARHIPGWSKDKFIREMNIQAKKWGLDNTSFVDSSGLSPMNRSSINDYKDLTMHVVKNPVISEISSSQFVYSKNKWDRPIQYGNSNRLIRLNGFETELSKTGHIRESGYNLVHLSGCKNNIGVIEFGARSSEQRSNFVRQKLSQYGCAF